MRNVRSLEVFRVAPHLPVNETLQVVEHHVLVGLYLLIGEDNAEVDAGVIHSVLVFYWLPQPLQIKVML